MNEIFSFTKEETTRDISLEMLCQSLMVRDSRGQSPSNRPIQSWELIDEIHGLCTAAGLDVEIKHIYVQQNGSNPVINQNEKELYLAGDNIPITKWLFNKVAFMIAIHHPEDTETTTTIVASYHQQGIQVAWGQHVGLCSNMCIFGSNTMYTFGPDSVPFDKMRVILNEWILTFDEKRNEDLKIIRDMKRVILNNDVMEEILNNLIGRLFRKAVRKNYFKGKDYVLDMTKVGMLVRNIEEKYELRKQLEPTSNSYDQDMQITLWDVYNWGTEILKAEDTDIASLFMIISTWGKFISEFAEFCNEMNWSIVDRSGEEQTQYLGTIFRDLDNSEEQEFGRWARDNYTPGQPIAEIWHPITRAECELMNIEAQESLQKSSEPDKIILPTDEDF